MKGKVLQRQVKSKGEAKEGMNRGRRPSHKLDLTKNRHKQRDYSFITNPFVEMLENNRSCGTPLKRQTFGIIMIEVPFRIIKIMSAHC